MRFFVYGVASGSCYGVLFLFLNDPRVMNLFVRTDGWYPLLPVLTAFVFSIAHGGFTGAFWDVLGVKAKAVKAKPDAAPVAGGSTSVPVRRQPVAAMSGIEGSED